jgi:hypothetical protein
MSVYSLCCVRNHLIGCGGVTSVGQHVYAVNKRFEEERKKRGEALPAKYSIPPPNADAIKHHNAK